MESPGNSKPPRVCLKYWIKNECDPNCRKKKSHHVLTEQQKKIHHFHEGDQKKYGNRAEKGVIRELFQFVEKDILRPISIDKERKDAPDLTSHYARYRKEMNCKRSWVF